MNELVSVYLPTFNRRYLLKRAVNSVLAQTYTNLELLIVDDGSTDNTSEYLFGLQATESRVRVLNKPKDLAQGAPASRNLAIRLAEGQYITGLDDDDELLPDHIETLVAKYDSNKSFVASSILKNHGSKIKRSVLNNVTGNITLKQILHSNIVGNQVLTTTDKLRAIDGFDERLPALQDLDTWIRLIERFGPGVKLKSATYVQDVSHTNDRISSSSNKRLYALDCLVEKHGHLFSSQHWKSVELRRLMFNGGVFKAVDFIRLVTFGNVRKITAFYLHQRLSDIKSVKSK